VGQAISNKQLGGSEGSLHGSGGKTKDQRKKGWGSGEKEDFQSKNGPGKDN